MSTDKTKDNSPNITEERLQEILMKMDVAWDRNGNVQKISKKEASQDSSLDLLTYQVNDLIEDKKSNKKVIQSAFLGSLLAVVGAAVSWGTNANEIENNTKALERIEEKLDNLVTTEQFDEFKDATNTEILDRKNYYGRLENRVVELEKN